MPNYAGQLNVRRIEHSLSSLKDVHAVKVALDEAGNAIEEIHVLASPVREPKRIVRDIESLLLVQYNLRIDYRCVSLAQLTVKDLRAFYKRPKLLSIRQNMTETDISVAVRLRYQTDIQVVGEARGRPEPADACHTAALAAIKAVSQLIEYREKPVLEKTQIISSDTQPVVLVYLTCKTPQGEERLLGATIGEPDIVHGAVRATLDAVNRRFFE